MREELQKENWKKYHKNVSKIVKLGRGVKKRFRQAVYQGVTWYAICLLTD